MGRGHGDCWGRRGQELWDFPVGLGRCPSFGNQRGGKTERKDERQLRQGGNKRRCVQGPDPRSKRCAFRVIFYRNKDQRKQSERQKDGWTTRDRESERVREHKGKDGRDRGEGQKHKGEEERTNENSDGRTRTRARARGWSVIEISEAEQLIAERYWAADANVGSVIVIGTGCL